MLRLIPAVVLALEPPAGPVPIQRPEAMESESESAPESEATPEAEAGPEAEAESEAAPESEPEPESLPESQSVSTARIVGTLTDTEIADAPLHRTQVEAVCTCLPEPRTTITDAQGRFEFTDLPAGVYTIVASRGGRPTHEVVAVADGDSSAVELRVEPPTASDELDARDYQRARANTMIAAGGVAGLGAIVMLLASAIEARKPDCKFELESCSDAPRPAAIIGLGVTGGILALASAALIGTGVHKRRKLDARVGVDDRSVSLTISGRF